MRHFLFIIPSFFIFSCQHAADIELNDEEENNSNVESNGGYFRSSLGGNTNSKEVGCVVSGSAQITTTTKDSINSQYSVNYQYYKCTDSIFKDSLNKKIVYLMNNEGFEGFEWKKEINSEMFQNYIYVIDSVFKEGDKEFNYSMGWFVERVIEISQSKNFVYMCFSGYSYTGGAHGNGFISNFIFDKSNGKELLLNDLVSDVRALEVIADPYFRIQNFSNPNLTYEQAGYDFEKLVLNDNFYFENDSLCFFYNPYEIASYAYGTSELKIPLKEIEHLLLIKP